MFKAPRRPAVRPYSEPIGRDDDAIVGAGETTFVTGLVQQQRKGWGIDQVPPAAKGQKKKYTGKVGIRLTTLLKLKPC